MEKEKLSRNDYFKKVQELGAKRTEKEYEIAPLDLSKYKVNEKTIKVLNANFMEESKDRNGPPAAADVTACSAGDPVRCP